MAGTLHTEFNCEICGKKFSKRQSLTDHIRRHTGEKNYECPVCKKRFVNSSNLNSHQKTHSLLKEFECQFCQKRLASSTCSRKHTQLMHLIKEKKFKCGVCDVKFKTEVILARHQKFIHDPQKRCKFVCVFCNKGFPESREFDAHLRTHTKERSNFCNFCPTELFSRQGLKEHSERHQPGRERKNSKCLLCPKEFQDTGNLSVHLRSHTGERPFKCEICQRRFASQGVLKCHIRSHSEFREFECIICKTSFKSADKLSRHHKMVHSQENKYFAEFVTKGSLPEPA